MRHTVKISAHEVRVFRALQQNGSQWLSSAEVGALTPDVALRTVRQHILKFVGLDLVEQRPVFPGYRYRWTGRNRVHVQRLTQAEEAMGINISS